MRIPVVCGVIDRRILVNYHVDPNVLVPLLPAPFRPKVIYGVGMVGICLIRLTKVRPTSFPSWLGISSENAGHRTTVEWDDHGTVREGVYVRRRDTNSWLNSLAGGRVFPGIHHHAKFTVKETADRFEVALCSDDGVTQRRSRFWVACAWSCCLVRAWSRPCLRELASKMRPSFVIMAWFHARPQCKQGRSHGCTVFGSLGAGISETGTTPRQACRVALRFDASVCHSASLETSQTRRQAARLPRPDTLDAATPHPDCRHHDLVCRGNGRRPLRAVPSLLRPDSCPQATATWQDLQRLLRGDAPSAHARLVGILRCRAVARLSPLGRPYDHGRLAAVGV